MKIYLDNCCLNRPFDDQSFPRIRLESEAVKAILSLCDETEWTLLSSDVLAHEIKQIAHPGKREYLQLIISSAQLHIKLQPIFRERAKFFEQNGIKAFDALHLACAEAHADVLLTTDDKFIKRAVALTDVDVVVSNPLSWVEEVL